MPNASTSTFDEWELGCCSCCNSFVRDLMIWKSFFWSPAHSRTFQKNIPSLSRQWQSSTCCTIIYILLYIFHFYGVTSALQPWSICLPSVTFETFGLIIVPRHSRFIFTVLDFSGAWSFMIFHSVVLYIAAIISHGSSLQVDSMGISYSGRTVCVNEHCVGMSEKHPIPQTLWNWDSLITAQRLVGHALVPLRFISSGSFVYLFVVSVRQALQLFWWLIQASLLRWCWQCMVRPGWNCSVHLLGAM